MIPNNLIVQNINTLEVIIGKKETIAEHESNGEYSFIIIELYNFNKPVQFATYADIIDKKQKEFSDQLNEIHRIKGLSGHNPLQYNVSELIGADKTNKIIQARDALNESNEQKYKNGITPANNGINVAVEMMDIYPSNDKCLYISPNKNKKIITLIHIRDDLYAVVANYNGKYIYHKTHHVPNIINIMTIYSMLYGKDKATKILEKYDPEDRITVKKSLLYNEIDNMNALNLRSLMGVDIYQQARESLSELKHKINMPIKLKTDGDSMLSNYIDYIDDVIKLYNTQMKNLLNSAKVQHFKLQKYIPVFDKGIVTRTILHINKFRLPLSCNELTENECKVRFDCVFDSTAKTCNEITSTPAKIENHKKERIRHLLYCKYIIDKLLTQRLILINIKGLSIVEKNIINDVSMLMDICLITLKNIYEKIYEYKAK